MGKETRGSSIAVRVTDFERDVLNALRYIEDRPVSDIVYPWIKTHIAVIAERADVQTIIAQKEKVVHEPAS